LSSAALYSQPISFGVKGGVPMTDFLNAVSNSRGSVNQYTDRYIIGPTVELHLPFGFGAEFDVLYRHFSYNSTAALVDALITARASSSDWEFPLLAKKKFMSGPARPFVDVGISFSKLSGLSQTVQTLVAPNRLTTTTTSNPAELRTDYTKGFVLGGGVDIHFLMLHISPEIRYTRWGSQKFNSTVLTGAVNALGGSLTSNQNEAEFLIGITF